MPYKQLTLSLVSMIFLISCGSNGKHNNALDILDPLGVFTQQTQNETFSLEEKKAVHTLFKTEYLWADQVKQNIDYEGISTPTELIDTLRVTPPDKWSFSMTKTEYDDYVNQKTEGFGFAHTQNDHTIYLVRIGAPADGKLKRGDRLIAINGMAVSNENIQQAKQNTSTPATFTIEREGVQQEVRIRPSAYTFKVSQGKILAQNTQKIGYLRYDSFTSTSVEEFEQEFTKFKQANISDLIIDLRYNGGGSIAVASTLLDNITNQYAGQRQVYLDWNANNKDKNTKYSFDEVEANDLNMQRVFFLVTKKSASASELVISALKPYLGEANVITIGTNTHGKNVGMSGQSYGNDYYFLINFFVKNNANVTTSFEGIPPTCEANDDISHDFGDPQESMLKTALSYISTGVCP